MKWQILFMIGSLVVLGGCLKENRCEPEGRALVCTDGTEVDIGDDEISEDASCMTNGDVVMCDSGDVYDIEEEEIENGEVPSDEVDGGEGEEETDSGGWVSCLAAEDGVLTCENGEEVVDESMELGRDDCRWHRRPGVGPRVVCVEGDLEFIPEGGDEDVECSWTDRRGREFIECTDGTRLELEDHGSEDCEPLFVSEDEGYVVSCGDEEFAVKSVEDEWCGYPSGEFRVTEENLEELRGCWAVFGNLVVEGLDEEELWGLEEIELVTGSVFVLENPGLVTVPPGDLWWIEERAVIRGNDSLEYFLFFEGTHFIDGGVEISGNRNLWEVVLPELEETPEMIIGSNERLEDLFVKWGGFRNLEIAGSLLFLDNESYPLCRAIEVLVEGTDAAEGGAFVGGMASEEDSRWACE